MMKVMIVDDVEQDLRDVASMVRAHYGEQYCRVRLCVSALEALETLEDCQGPDLAILDIAMPGMNGVELAGRMRDAGWDGHIVFLTASNDFAAESYRVGATGYILKPSDAEQVSAALRHIDSLTLNVDAPGFLINRKGNTRRVMYRELMYVEVIQHKLRFHLRGGEVEQSYGSMKECARSMLDEPCMIQPNQSYLINMDYIRAFEARTVVMWDGERISVPRGFSQFQSRCVHWMFEKR